MQSDLPHYFVGTMWSAVLTALEKQHKVGTFEANQPRVVYRYDPMVVGPIET
jgi:hypothetical protein